MVRAFTLFESLLTLLVVSSLAVLLSGSVQSSFQAVEEQLFLTEFEHFYVESQRQSLVQQQAGTLVFKGDRIRSGQRELRLPASMKGPEDLTLQFDKAGGNSSLAKLTFSSPGRTVTYQLYLGNGKFKKSQA